MKEGGREKGREGGSHMMMIDTRFEEKGNFDCRRIGMSG